MEQTPKKDWNSDFLLLFKYPVMVFSILIALWTAKWTLGIDFTRIIEIGPVKFNAERQKLTSEIVTDLDSRISQTQDQVDKIKKNLLELSKIKVATSESASLSHESKNKIAEIQKSLEQLDQTALVEQQVSDETAKLSVLAREDNKKKLQGYVWMGNYYGNEWSKPTFGYTGTDERFKDSPEKVKEGNEYYVLGNLIVRKSMPKNDDAYFRGTKSIGVIERGTRIRILSAPQEVKRNSLMQYWVKIEAEM